MNLLKLFKKRKNSKKNKKNKKQQYLEKEILRRDKIIADLRERNSLLLKTTIRQSNEIINLKEKIRKLNDQLHQNQKNE